MLHHLVDVLTAYGPWGVFVLALLDSAGVPVPAAMDILILGIGWKSSSHAAYLAALLATIGSLLGNIGLFWAARGGGRRWVKAVPEPDKPQRFRSWFRRYGLVTVFIPALFPVVPLPLKVFVISAGALHTRFIKFAGVILLARIIRYFGLAYIGIQLGEDADYFLEHNAFTIIAAAIGLALGLLVLIKLNGRRGRNARIP